jgi:hypothetical protein
MIMDIPAGKKETRKESVKGKVRWQEQYGYFWTKLCPIVDNIGAHQFFKTVRNSGKVR